MVSGSLFLTDLSCLCVVRLGYTQTNKFDDSFQLPMCCSVCKKTHSRSAAASFPRSFVLEILPNGGLRHEHLRQSAARPAGGVSVTSGNSGSAISSKTRIRWTQDLHDRFVECVNHLGGAESNGTDMGHVGCNYLQYTSKSFDDLFATVTFLIQNSPGSVFIATYHNKSGHHLIEFLMAKWGLKPLYKASGLAEIVLNSEEVR
ncbi:hypothetical protein TEA_018908 [Camellia sinensis var. sinensis]|uniref:Uncharacterized protein n=1 Tax=Camellia sinensis var. sinensis TaxID=542762 RepID=A0A4S4EEN5_CAMSN|nr:hypothetical protein TEA_018908 [Camellia sinensis var. sinensis]